MAVMPRILSKFGSDNTCRMLVLSPMRKKTRCCFISSVLIVTVRRAKDLIKGPPLIHDIYRPGHHADLSFHWAVKDGTKQHHWHFGDMPPIADVSPEQVGHIIAYVRREQRRAGIR